MTHSTASLLQVHTLEKKHTAYNEVSINCVFVLYCYFVSTVYSS